MTHPNSAQHPRNLAPLAPCEWLPADAWPFPSGALDVNGHRIAVTDVGDGPTLLFVHTGLWSFLWRDVIARLSRDFRCLTLDAPGTGRSDAVPASAISLAASAHAVGAVIEQLDLTNVTLVFHDLGGAAALGAAATHPDRIQGLVAVNTFAWRPRGFLFRTMLAVIGSTAMRETDALTGFLPRASSTRLGAGKQWTRRDRRIFSSGMNSDGRRAFHRYMADARHADPLFEAIDTALRGPLADRPLLTIFGQHNDPLHFQPQWLERFPNAQQVVVSNGLHFPMCDDPDLVAESIRDWRETHGASQRTTPQPRHDRST
jgi:haloalkane dehalogenase